MLYAWINEPDEIRVDYREDGGEKSVVPLERFQHRVSLLPQDPVVPSIAYLFACQSFQGVDDEPALVRGEPEGSDEGRDLGASQRVNSP